MKKLAMLLAASAVAFGVYSCSKGGAALKSEADSVSFATGFTQANDIINAIKNAREQGEKIDSVAFFKGFEEGFNSDSAKLWYYVGQMQGIQAAMRLKDDSVLKKNIFLDGFKQALKLDSAGRAKQADSLMQIAQAYYMKQQQAQQEKAEAEMQKQMAEQYKENKQKGEAFIASFKKEAGVKTTASGLAYQVIKEGTGATPKATDVVKVNYKGTLVDGTLFDESKTPAEFRVDGVIKGWTEILQLMKVGEKVKVVIPQELAYGARHAGEKIEPLSTLVFEIELLDIIAPAAADSTSAH